MRDYIEFETTPSDEPCVQVGHDLYRPIASMEAQLMKSQLEELLLTKYSDILINITITQCPHDFGTYYELRAYYDGDNEKQSEQAFFLDNNYPEEWSPDKKKILLDYCKNKGFSYS
jgi:hypothetical protein